MRTFEMPHETAPFHPPGLSRPAAIALAAATILSIAVVAAHPTITGGAPGQILADMAKSRDQDEHVHGAVILLTGAYCFGFAGLAARLGLRRPAVLAGLIAYGIGALAMIGAALLD